MRITLTLIALATLAACSGAPQQVPQVPAELVCKLNVLLNLPKDPERIDYLAVKELIEGVRGCDAIHSDAGP